MADAVFTEVLEIQIDTASFVAGLQQLETAYEDFVDRVNAKGLGAGNIINIGSFTEIQTQLSQLQSYVQQFDASMSQSMDDLDSKFQQVQAGVEATSQVIVDAKAKAAQDGGGGGTSNSPFVQSSGINAFSVVNNVVSQISNSLGLQQGTIGAMIAQIAGVRLAWQSVGTAIRIVTDIIKAPFEFLGTGVEYLKNLQEEAAGLQGPIAANVTLSSNLGENFKLAGQAAAQVAVQLEDMAAKLNIPVQQIQQNFVAVLEGGGMNMVHNLQGAVDLTKEFTLALSKLATPAQAARLALQEIPKLLDGSEASSSKVLEVLHLTKDQWEAMRQQALQHGDLVEQLASKLQPYLSVIDQANLRYTVLNNQIELQGHRIAASMALPLFNLWIEVLQKVEGYLEQNGASLAAMGRSIVSLVTDYATGAEHLAQWSGLIDIIKGGFEGVVVLLASIANIQRTVFDLIMGFISDLHTLLVAAFDPRSIFSPSLWKDTFDKFVENGKETGKKLASALTDELKVLGTTGPAKVVGDNLLAGGLPSHDITDPNADKEAKQQFAQIQESYRSELTTTKEHFRQVQDDIKQREQDGVISAQDAAKQKIAAYKQEQDQIGQLVDAYKFAASQSNFNKDVVDPNAPVQISRFNDQLNNEQLNASRTAKEGQRQAEREANQASFRELQNSYRNDIDETKKVYENALSALNDAEKANTINYKQAADDRIVVIDAERTKLLQIIDTYKQLADNSKLPTVQKETFVAGLDKADTDLSATAEKQIATTIASTRRQDEADALRHDEALRQIETAHKAAMAALVKQEATEGLVTKTQAFDAEVQAQQVAHQNTLAILAEEYVAADENLSKKKEILDKMVAEEQRYTDATRNNAQQLMAIHRQEQQQFTIDVSKNDVLRAEVAADTAATDTRVSNHNRLIQSNIAVAQAELVAAQAVESGAKSQLAEAEAEGVHGDALEQYVQKYLQAQIQVQKAQQNVNVAQSQTDVGARLQYIFGKGVTDLKSAFDGFSQTVSSLSNATSTFAKDAQSVINAVQSGMQSGGVLGGIGGGLNAAGGIASQFGPTGAIIGGIMSAVGSVFSLIGGLFTAAARHLAEEIKKDVTDITNSYSTGQATLAATITALEAERQKAITDLSGKKGGQEELNVLLPQIDQQLAQYKLQQEQIFENFQKQVAVLNQQGSQLGSFLQTWQQINDQIKQYLDAGGDVALAQQALNDTLQQQLTNAQQSLEQADQQAISDALSLNQLLQQRAQMESQYLIQQQQQTDQYLQQKFALQNSDALERQAYTSATSQAIQLAQQKQIQDEQSQLAAQQYQQQLDQINAQIDLTQQKVQLEKQVFSLASDTATLQKQSDALAIDQLNTQIKQWQDLQTIIKGITQNPDGSFSNNLFTAQTVSTNPAQTAALTPQITALQNQIDQLQNKADNYNGNSDTYVANLDNQIQRLTTQLDTLTKQLPATYTIQQLNSSVATTPTSAYVNPSNPSGVTVGTLQVNITGVNPNDPNAAHIIANNILQELRTQGRYGADTSYSS